MDLRFGGPAASSGPFTQQSVGTRIARKLAWLTAIMACVAVTQTAESPGTPFEYMET
jgi:hypothetical protein